METILLLAQAQAPRAGNPLIGMLPFLLLFFLFWVMIIVPNRRQARAHAEMVGGLQKGDLVVTQGGLIGEITGIKDDQVQLRTGQAVVLVERARIARKTGPVAAGESK